MQLTSLMPRPRTNRKTTRLTVTLDEDVHERLCEIATRDDVSVAWIVRRAVNELIYGRTAANDQPELPLRATENQARARE